MNMRALNSIVTDSSAASSSWGCGSRIVNGAVNVLPDGRNLRTLYSLFDEAGWKRGLVTTTEITHATPAGFAVNQDSRGDADGIAAQYLARRIDVLLGGGRKFFEAKDRKDKRDLKGEFRAHGYDVFQTLAEMRHAALQKRWLGVFAESHLPFTIDHANDQKTLETVPTLAAMTESALRWLGRHSHFILQVEGGRVDHGCHNCDAAGAFHDMLAFDEALEVCLEFQRQQPDTLLVMTTDHGNGNPGLNGMGDKYANSSKLFANLRRVQCSFPEIQGKIEKIQNEEDLRLVFGQLTGFEPSLRQASLLMTFFEKKGQALYDSMNSVTVQIGQLLANHIGVGWAGSAHTGDYVPLLAVGPGAERFRGFIQNTDVFRHYLALAKIDFRNPDLPLIAETHPSADTVEAVATYAEPSRSIAV
jgi:alkaline phosphatase